MDTSTLVENHIDDGESLLTRLREQGFAVCAAFWARHAEDDRWSLYLATPALNQMGILPAYGSVLRAFRSLVPVSFEGSNVIKLVPENDDLALAVLTFSKRFPELSRKTLKQPMLGDVPAEELYIYSLHEVQVPIYGLVYRGDPSGSLHLSFKAHKPHRKIIETGPSGVHEYPAETGIDWVVAAPEGAKIEQDKLGICKLRWDFAGKRRLSSANEIMALADLGRSGFRILHEPSAVNCAPVISEMLSSDEVIA